MLFLFKKTHELINFICFHLHAGAWIMLCVICHSITFCRHFTCNKGVDTKDREKLENKWSDFV